MPKILVTGTAGFIGYNLVRHLSDIGFDAIGMDNLSAHPVNNFKYERLASLGFNKQGIEYNKPAAAGNYKFIHLDLNDSPNLNKLFEQQRFDFVLHLAAQTGVRNSVENPLLYIDNNIRGFCSLLEACKKYTVKNVIYSSSSSVYGLSDKYPFEENQPTDFPMSVYAASKKSGELLAHVYSSLYGIATTGLRFFTVYGPWTRSDMAVYLFIKAIYNGTPITLFNKGNMFRDFTYVDDVAKAVSLLISKLDNPQELKGNKIPYEILNIGNQTPVKVIELISTIEKALNRKAIIDTKPLQAGDMLKTFADTDKLYRSINYRPGTSVETGIQKTVSWYLKFTEQCKKTSSYL